MEIVGVRLFDCVVELNSAIAWFGDVATDDGNGSNRFGIRSCIRIAVEFGRAVDR